MGDNFKLEVEKSKNSSDKPRNKMKRSLFHAEENSYV
jgi:hypothetical protein